MDGPSSLQPSNDSRLTNHSPRSDFLSKPHDVRGRALINPAIEDGIGLVDLCHLRKSTMVDDYLHCIAFLGKALVCECVCCQCHAIKVDFLVLRSA